MVLNRLRQLVWVVLLLAFAAPAMPASASVCTLADHIRSANTNTAVGFCPAGTSHDIITIAEDITLTEPLPPITGTITIEGGGHTISGDKQFRIFDVRGGALTIKNLTLIKAFTKYDHYNGSSWHAWGGAIAVDKGALNVNNSVFLENHSGGGGGAIALQDSTATINSSAFIRNSASESSVGGGVGIGHHSKVDITNSTFYDNSAGAGGGVGTRILPGASTFTTLTNVTMIGNLARRGQSVFADEDDANFRVRNSILVSIGHRNCHGRLSEDVGNLINGGTCAPALEGNPMVGELVGSPAYFPLLDGSPALDAADARFCPATDQIGTPRPQGGGCDIGAIESLSAIAPPRPKASVCNLHDQIIAANTDRAYMACPAGNGADTIEMIRDYELDKPLPSITSEIAIEGNSHEIRADMRFPIFDVDGGQLTIANATLTGGNASRGGAIRLRNGATVSAANVRFSGNQAIQGGAISTESEDDRLAVSGSSFVNNAAEKNGGAILADGGIIEVKGSAFQSNQAQEYGGAIAAAGGDVAMSNSTFHGNKAQKKGGSVYISGAAATLTHLTLTNNVAGRIAGAGIYRESGSLYLRNSIVAGSGSGDDCSGGLNQSRGNFSQDGSCSTEAGGDPMLGELVGSPAHHPLANASPAQGAADPVFCLPTDQLGRARAHCDIGAIETERDPNYVPAPIAGLPDSCTLADQIIAANTDAPVGSCPAGEGADIITFRSDIALNQALPAIASDITFSGMGHSLSGNHRSSIFDIQSGNVVIKNMNLINGNNREGEGGAITLRNRASLIAANLSFRNNRARYGGAIASLDSSELKVFDSIFLDNSAELSGGAIWDNGACGYIDDNEFRRNRAGAPSRKESGSHVQPILHLDGVWRRCGSQSGNTFSDQ